MEASIKCELGFVSLLQCLCVYLSSRSSLEHYGSFFIHVYICVENCMLQICDMVTIARHLNLTLVVPELDKRSFWADPR